MNKNICLKICGIVIIMVLIILLCFILKNQYKTPINNYYKGLQNANAKTYSKSFPDFMGVNKTKTEENLKEDLEELQSVYGNNIKIKYKVISKEKYKNEELNIIEKFIEKRYNSKAKVSAGFYLNVEEKISGSTDSNVAQVKMYVYKVNGEWKLIPFSPENVKNYVEE